MIRDSNSITILGSMRNNLNLKGTELLVFAIIYGFSQDGESEFYGSRKYIAEWLGNSLPTVDKAIEGLIEKGFIEKTTDNQAKGEANRYKVSLYGINILDRGCKETLQVGCKKTLHNNKSIDKEKEIIKEFAFPPRLEEAIDLWLQYKKEKKSKYQPTGLKMFLAKLNNTYKDNNEDYVIEGIHFSIERNYSGVYYPNKTSYYASANKKPKETRETKVDNNGVFSI